MVEASNGVLEVELPLASVEARALESRRPYSTLLLLALLGILGAFVMLLDQLPSLPTMPKVTRSPKPPPPAKE